MFYNYVVRVVEAPLLGYLSYCLALPFPIRSLIYPFHYYLLDHSLRAVSLSAISIFKILNDMPGLYP
jgi:hypothetical protein